MATKLRDVVVKTGEYQDRNTGETKGRWQNVGSLMRNDNDNSYFVVLDRTFNPAGVSNPENRSSVILSCFTPQDRRNDGGSGEGRKPQDSSSTGGSAYGGSTGGAPGMDDDLDTIPF